MQLTNRRKKRFRIDITPLIDVVFLLLIFFMLTFSVQGQGVDISLPDGNSGTEDLALETALILKLNADGLMTLNNETVDFNSLVPVLENKISSRKDKSLTVDIHKRVEYDLFVRVLDSAKKAGAENFSIIR